MTSVDRKPHARDIFSLFSVGNVFRLNSGSSAMLGDFFKGFFQVILVCNHTVRVFCIQLATSQLHVLFRVMHDHACLATPTRRDQTLSFEYACDWTQACMVARPGPPCQTKRLTWLQKTLRIYDVKVSKRAQVVQIWECF